MRGDTAVAGDADIALIGALMGEPARAAVLTALLDGRALAASTLASEAGVSPSTLSSHLARLVDGGLVEVQASGRHRYFRITRPEVAQALEALARRYVLNPKGRSRLAALGVAIEDSPRRPLTRYCLDWSVSNAPTSLAPSGARYSPASPNSAG